MDDALVEVAQADRQSAASLVEWHNRVANEWDRPEGGTMQFFTSAFPGSIRNGTWDEHPVVQAFARHRLTGVIAGREEAARVADSEADDIAQHVHTANDDWQGGRAAMARTIAAAIRSIGPRP